MYVRHVKLRRGPGLEVKASKFIKPESFLILRSPACEESGDGGMFSMTALAIWPKGEARPKIAQNGQNQDFRSEKPLIPSGNVL